MGLEFLIGLAIGIFIGYANYRACKQGLNDQIEDLQKGKEKAEHELDGAFDDISSLEHELVVKQNVINSLSEKVNRLQTIVNRTKK